MKRWTQLPCLTFRYYKYTRCESCLLPGCSCRFVDSLISTLICETWMKIKRIHEYKRQFLNILSVIKRYLDIKKMSPEERKEVVPRVCVIGGKAASAYDMAKRIVALANAVSKKVNNDPEVGDLLKLYFLPDYNVSLAEILIPGIVHILICSRMIVRIFHLESGR